MNEKNDRGLLISQTEVELMLKSPSTAEHPVCTEWYHSVVGNTHVFDSYVDSQIDFELFEELNIHVK